MGQARTYTDEFKAQALKLAKEVGTKRAAEELGVPKTLLEHGYARRKRAR